MDQPKDAAETRELSQQALGHALSAYDPQEGRVLTQGITLSGLFHLFVSVSLAVYGAELLLDEALKSPARQIHPPPIQAKFLFEEKEEVDLKPHLVPERVAEAVKPKKKPKRRKPKRPKKLPPKRVEAPPAVDTSTPAPKEAPAKESENDAPKVIALGSKDSKASTNAPSATGDKDRPKGPISGSSSEGEAADTAKAGVESTIDRKGRLKAYVRTLSKAVRKRRTYPRAAKLAGLEGRAVVRILIDAQGNIVSVELAKSSGHDILDRAALEAARGVGRLPAPPSALNWKTRAIKVPFNFKVSG